MSTIYDVAKRANVSTATVSYAFNKPHMVKPETHERILQAALELDYKPNLFARGLAGGKTQMVGLLVADIRYPYTATAARGIEDVLRANGYLSFISSTDGDTEETIHLLQNLHARGVEGFILIPSYFGMDNKLLQTMKSMVVSDIPIVLAGGQLDNSMFNVVTYRPQAATKEAVDHLIELGHRDIAYIGSYHSKGHALTRYLGYQESLMASQIPLRPELVIETDVIPAEVRQAMATLFDLPEPPTAVFALNDIVAMSVIDFCRERGIRVPDDLSLASFDYVTLAQRSTPRITSIVLPMYEIGRQAAELLVKHQENPGQAPQQVVVNYTFEIRHTTAVAPTS